MKNNTHTTIRISKENRNAMKEISEKLRWGYDALIEDFLKIYKDVKKI